MRPRIRVLTLLLSVAPALSAATLNFGIISFDVLTPAAGTQLGVNVLNFQNLTGASTLPPDFPIATSLILSDFTVNITTPSGNQVLLLGQLDPGSFPSGASLQFPSNQIINSVSLSGTLSPLSFTVSGGGVENALSSSVLFNFLPSAGTDLQAGIDLGIITIETAAPVAAIPEPGTVGLLAVGVAAAIARRLRS